MTRCSIGPKLIDAPGGWCYTHDEATTEMAQQCRKAGSATLKQTALVLL